MAYTPEEREEKFKYTIGQIEKGRSLRSVTQDEKAPSLRAFLDWVERDPDKAQRYTRAMELRADKIFEEILQIADDSSGDESITDRGNVVMDQEFAARSKIRIDARKWILAKMVPKKYGDKIDITSDNKAVTVAPIVGMVIKNETPDEEDADLF